MREIRKIFCSCGGEVTEVETTPTEDKRHGCGRKGCCVNAYECNKCKSRWTFTYESPELSYD